VSAPQNGYVPHPLFPRDEGGPERRDIQFISFRRRRRDGKIDHSPEDIPAGEIHSWYQVVVPWGGGEYKAIAKDKNHFVVACYPEKSDAWARFDGESKPFTFRDPRDPYNSPSPPLAPAVEAAPSASRASTFLETELLTLLAQLRATPSASTFSLEEANVAMIHAHIEFLRTLLRVTRNRPEAASLITVLNPMILAAQLLTALLGGVPGP
jgi:hypothetical protein